MARNAQKQATTWQRVPIVLHGEKHPKEKAQPKTPKKKQ
jgi:hypothetical protein